MAVSSSYAFNMNRTEILTDAWRLVTGSTPSADELDRAATILGRKLKSLQDDGVIVTAVERTSATITSGTATYTTGADTVDVLEVVVRDTSGNDTPLQQISRREYMEIATKTTTGKPTQYYCERTTSTVQILLYPVPTSSSATLQYSRVRVLRDMDSGSVTPDLPQRWMDALVYMVAADLALMLGAPVQRITYLKGLAQEARGEASSDASEKGDVQFTVRAWRPF